MEHSNLKRLPPELRNDIYEILLTSECPLKLELTAPFKGITEVCREIRSECRKFFWANNSFTHDCRARTISQVQNAAASILEFLAHYLGTDILNVAGSIHIRHHVARNREDRGEMTIYSGTQCAARNPQVHTDIWERNMGGVGMLGPNSEFLRQILRSYDHLGFEVYALKENRHHNWVATFDTETEYEILERERVCKKNFWKHYEFCVVLPTEEEELESEASWDEELEKPESEDVERLPVPTHSKKNDEEEDSLSLVSLSINHGKEGQETDSEATDSEAIDSEATESEEDESVEVGGQDPKSTVKAMTKNLTSNKVARKNTSNEVFKSVAAWSRELEAKEVDSEATESEESEEESDHEL